MFTLSFMFKSLNLLNLKIYILKSKFSSNIKKYIFFYFTLIYLLAFLFWWTYLLYHKTDQYYKDSLRFEVLKHSIENSPLGSYLNSVEYETELERFKRDKIMIITESIVFCIVLLFLVFKVKKAVEHEIELSKQQQNFILSITHELKSPLSSIKLMSQTLKRHNLKDSEKNMLINNSLKEVDRLQNLVENVLLAAKIDNNSYGFLKRELNLSELTEALVKSCRTAKNANIEAEIEPHISFNADKTGMTSVIVNLIENAIKYSKEEILVNVALFKKGDKVFFVVKDQGIGIVGEEKYKIFDKFYRVGNEDTRATKGTGLGLYIVKQLVLFHNGDILVRDNKPKGIIFEVVFKL